MPNKTCEKCKESIHVRVAKCKCGHVFYTPVRKTKEELNAKEESEKVEVKASVQPPPLVKVLPDPKILLAEQAEQLGFTIRAGEVYKFNEHHKYTAVVSPLGKITGVQWNAQ